MTDKFVGAFIELIPNESNEGIDFRFGWEFPPGVDPEVEDIFKNLVAGIFGLLGSQDEEILAIGEIVRNVSGFDESMVPVGDTEIIFTPDEALLDKLDTGAKVIDISQFKPKGDK
tara:strand:+ start:207 stop:551 length:345 start_codon:yes stop_codon:yes gene_type:complete